MDRGQIRSGVTAWSGWRSRRRTRKLRQCRKRSIIGELEVLNSATKMLGNEQELAEEIKAHTEALEKRTSSINITSKQHKKRGRLLHYSSRVSALKRYAHPKNP